MTASHQPLAGPASFRNAPAAAPLARAARTVDRWGLLAGVTGFLANVLLVVLFTTPADGPYAWTGPANDTVGVLSTLAMIPVAAGLLSVCDDNGPGLGAITSAAIVAMVLMAAVAVLFILGLVPFAADTDSAYIGLIFIFGYPVWLIVLSGQLPGHLADRAGRPGRPSLRQPSAVA